MVGVAACPHGCCDEPRRPVETERGERGLVFLVPQGVAFPRLPHDRYEASAVEEASSIRELVAVRRECRRIHGTWCAVLLDKSEPSRHRVIVQAMRGTVIASSCSM